MAHKIFVTYKRLSKEKKETERQHGFNTQAFIFDNYFKYLTASGDTYEVIEEYGEFYTGKGSYKKRVEFMKALEACKKHKAILLISTADRLARNLYSAAEILETIEVITADAPEDKKDMIQLRAWIAERELEKISARCKATAEALKAKGVKLGASAPAYKRNPNNPNTRRRTEAKDRVEPLRDIFVTFVTMGLKLQDMADNLNKMGKPLPSGKEGTWQRAQVSRVLTKLELK